MRFASIIIRVLLCSLLLSLFSLAQTAGSPPASIHRTIQQNDSLKVECVASPSEIQPGQSAEIKATAKGSNLIYSFGSSAGTVTVKGNIATLSTAGITTAVNEHLEIKVACIAVDSSNLTTVTTTQVGVSLPPTSMDLASNKVILSSPPAKEIHFLGMVAPSLSWITGTQTQTMLGGSAAVALLQGKKEKAEDKEKDETNDKENKKKQPLTEQYCDPRWQVGAEAFASNTTTQKLTGSPTYVDSDSGRVNGLIAVGGLKKDYLEAGADFYLNNSLGIGLMQTYAAGWQHYFLQCPTSSDSGGIRQSISISLDAGYTNERLYKTVPTVTSAVTPVSAQYQWAWFKASKPAEAAKGAPALAFSVQAGWTPLLSNSSAYRLYERSSIKIPTAVRWIDITFDQLDYYLNNAPHGYKRNYQNISLGLRFNLHPDSNPQPTDLGACWSGDQIKRLSCIDDIARTQCAATSIFERGAHCGGLAPATESQTASKEQKR